MSADGLSAADVVAVTCDTLEEGRTLALDVGDEVIVARITQRQTGDVTCPIDGCVRRFDSQKGLSTHLGKVHPEYDRRPECAECGERYDPSHTDQIYCSRGCYHNSGRTTLECEYCGEEFPIKESHADSRRHCSQECYLAHKQDGDSTKEERVCEAPGCDEVFEVYPSRSQRHCSRQCAGQGRSKEPLEKECPTCGATFETHASADSTYCSRTCFYEGRRDDDRPSGLRPLLHDLYVVDGFDVETTLDRVEVIKPEFLEDIGRDELKARILAGEAYLAGSDIPKSVTAPQVVGAARRCQSRVELQQDLRTSRDAVGTALARLDLQDDVESISAYETDVLDNVRDQLDIDVDEADDAEDDDPLGEYRAGVST